jgi:hypothetical protein
LDCKAGEAKHLLSALVPVLEKLFEGTRKEEEIKMISAATNLEKWLFGMKQIPSSPCQSLEKL